MAIAVAVFRFSRIMGKSFDKYCHCHLYTPAYIDKVKTLLTKSKKVKGIIITDHMHRHVVDISDALYVLANGQTYCVTDPQQLVWLGYVPKIENQS